LRFVIFSFPGCNSLENSTTSASKLIVESITGKDLSGQEGSTTIFSDVITGGSVFNDNAVAGLTVVSLDPFAPAATVTYYQSILVDQIDVRYTRADGLNTPGVDVPYGFSQRAIWWLVLEIKYYYHLFLFNTMQNWNLLLLNL